MEGNDNLHKNEDKLVGCVFHTHSQILVPVIGGVDFIKVESWAFFIEIDLRRMPTPNLLPT